MKAGDFRNTTILPALYMIIQAGLNSQVMDVSPQRKKARFSDYNEVFQYSSRGKRDMEGDNDSLLLQTDGYDVSRSNQKPGYSPEDNQDNPRLIEIEQISSDLAQIEAYLQQESHPEPIPQLPLQMTPQKDPNTRPTLQQRFTMSIKPELLGGRETMNAEQELKFKSAIREIPPDVSNNKKRQLQEESKQKTIEEKIEKHMEKNRRITMDIKDLMCMLNSYQVEDDVKKLRDERKNRITMDVFALSKMLDNTTEDEEIEDKNPLTTPMKNGEPKARKTKVFSAFNNNPQETEVKLFARSYIANVDARVQQTITENKRLSEIIAEQKSLLIKLEMKISDSKKRTEKNMLQKAQIDKKNKLMKQQLQKKKYIEDAIKIQQFQLQHKIKILKLHVFEQGFYGHFIFNDIYLKIKNKTKSGPTDAKFMISQDARENQKYYVIALDDSVKLLKKYHQKIVDKPDHIIEVVINLRKAYENIKHLDEQIYFFCLSFQPRLVQFSSNMDKLAVTTVLPGNRQLIIEIDLLKYMTDPTDSKSIAIYDTAKQGYLECGNEEPPRPNELLLVRKIKSLINLIII